MSRDGSMRHSRRSNSPPRSAPLHVWKASSPLSEILAARSFRHAPGCADGRQRVRRPVDVLADDRFPLVKQVARQLAFHRAVVHRY